MAEQASVEAGRIATKDTLKDIDDLLDEIDEVLESDAQAFIDAFIQKGGE